MCVCSVLLQICLLDIWIFTYIHMYIWFYALLWLRGETSGEAVIVIMYQQIWIHKPISTHTNWSCNLVTLHQCGFLLKCHGSQTWYPHYRRSTVNVEMKKGQWSKIPANIITSILILILLKIPLFVTDAYRAFCTQSYGIVFYHILGNGLVLSSIEMNRSGWWYQQKYTQLNDGKSSTHGIKRALLSPVHMQQMKK